uniref:Unconventional myosin-XVIIIb-like n=1 Tax=Castor canadensis TaxID=51338 RepID=A0A8B7TX68_CASCN|nr:unconventional myosin-XVIIIb-like [Castor canadensis]
MQLAQALGESVFERRLREKLARENDGAHWELSRLQQQLQQKEQETSKLRQEVETLQGQKRELLASSSLSSLGENGVTGLKDKLWELEAKAREHEKVQSQQKSAIEHLEQLRQRLQLEMERMKQMHQKDHEDQEEELEDVRQSCQKRLRQLELRLEQEHEEKRAALHEKQDLEGLVATLCEQIGHRDLDVEKRLRRDLRRTHALLSDVQLLLATTDDGKTSVSKEELEKVHSQVGSVGPPSRGAWHAGVTGQGSGATGRCEGWWGHLVSSSHGGRLSVCAGVHLCERCLVTARAGHQRNSSRASKGTVDRQWPFVCPDANGPAPETWGPLATPSRAPVPREVSPCPGHMALGQ